MHFADHILERCQHLSSRLVVGLDPHWDRIPDAMKRAGGEPATVVRDYLNAVIDQTRDIAVAFKPQMAFFEQFGPPGFRVLADILAGLDDAGIPVILDGKRNDIGSTAAAYARAVFGDDLLPAAFPASAATVNAYLGSDGIRPFMGRLDKGIFVLVKTSNPSSAEFQDLPLQETGRLADQVAAAVNRWNADSVGRYGFGNVGAVVGATYPEHVQHFRAAMPKALLLLPGYGAQGGSAAALQAAFDDNGLGALVNSSRGICFPANFARDSFAAVRRAALDARDEINHLIKST